MIYLDNQATTPLAPEARDAMLKWLDTAEGSGFGNPHSPHRMGRMAGAAIDFAREQVAGLLPPGGTVHFTGSACEAINLAMRGAGGDGPISVSAIEHAAVYETAEALGRRHLLNVAANGQCNTSQSLPQGTRLVCVMQVNNEIGTIQPTVEWHRKAKEHNALFLCDAVQSYGKMEVTGADMIAISAHKIYGPKGIGALWVRHGLELDPQITGGLQEGYRSGTLSTALVAGFGAAAAVAKERMDDDADHAEKLWTRARAMFASNWALNGDEDTRLHANLNVRRSGLDVARLMSECRDVMFSAGSACASGSGKTSHVLKAIGLSDEQAKSSIRIGWGRYTTMEQLETGVAAILDAANGQ
ncbi:aminotransferase class V-fold PLP-dependent enzyme [Erythrobacter arachoides]|uniref:Cysteine desulfurase n=1 Tax=Aurantiacibacter arachoides TaxID=1850444 RepID=A0A844ZZF4_9SPHN|nr:cysteine desulfurase family protein [Aurantiacibacter arachoides]MXO93563.1 aminotransferase class V-fold PLP-dependent enzyme [Aurantiacibacter arachoides]GGD48413.1 cysteine desulfurase IscS [Aurantiacibacter arachoides]